MKIKYLSPLVLLLGMLAPCAMAQQLPVMSVSLTEIDVESPAGAGLRREWKSRQQPRTPDEQRPTAQRRKRRLWINPDDLGACHRHLPGERLHVQLLRQRHFHWPGVDVHDGLQRDYAVSWTPPQPGRLFPFGRRHGWPWSHGDLPSDRILCHGHFHSQPGAERSSSGQAPLSSSRPAASVATGAVASVSFFDESGLLGSSRTYPYSIIYTPAGTTPTVHTIHAVSYNADGTIASTSASQSIVMTSAVLPLPVVSITTPANIPVSQGRAGN